MTNHPRRYGRRAPKNAPAIRLGDHLTGVVPAHPAAMDQLARLKGGWQMLGNDIAGDCVAVTWANFRRLVTAVLGAREIYPTQDQVWAIYKTQNPDFDPDGDENSNGPGSDADGGMDIQTLLEYLVKVGGPDGVKAVAFAKVDHTNIPEVQAAIAIFGGLWTGITVLDVNQQEFGNGQPWDYVKSSPKDGGHSVLTGGYGPVGAGKGALGGDERFLTWAEETSFTDMFWGHEVEEVWIVVWPEDLENPAFLAGINYASFSAAYTALTGGTLPAVTPPAPSPTPTPTPTPSPAVDANTLAAYRALQAWAKANKVT